jgi:N-acetylglucosaminyldiphosphoundecaprenol N-acetyl-beta-D-mannosaminyltransferase
MRDEGKRSVLGVLVDAVDYEGAVDRILEAARRGEPCAVSALAVHGVMSAVLDRELRARVNSLDLVTPDGQPVRWALNLLHRAGLPDRVYGPALMRRVLQLAEADGIPVYFYGSTPDVLRRLASSTAAAHPRLVVAGREPSRFAAASPDQQKEIATRIRDSGAQIVFVGLGCPRQEVFVSAMRDGLGLPVLAVGAAFDYLSGVLVEPAAWVQRAGLQWVWRLAAEPRRLWRRYVLLNPAYLALVAAQKLRLWRPHALDEPYPRDVPIAA